MSMSVSQTMEAVNILAPTQRDHSSVRVIEAIACHPIMLTVMVRNVIKTCSTSG